MDQKIDPSLLILNEGEFGKFNCLSKMPSQWYFSIYEDFSKAEEIHSGFILYFEPVELADSGYYFCTGHEETNLKPFVAKGELKVYG